MKREDNDMRAEGAAPRGRALKDLLLLFAILGAAALISIALSGVSGSGHPFAMPVFILAVALIARLTDGYLYGIAASVAGTFCVNYMFTYPFWEFDVTLSGYPLTFAVMLVVSVIISALTTQIKKQEQLRFAAEREKIHADLLRAVSHDIRTPLSSILGASSALAEQELSPEDRAALVSGINREARWLVRVTENLLSVTRVAGGDLALKKTDEVLEEIVGSAIVKYRRTPGALPVEVDRPDEILIVPMDATLIEQVLLNLFDNVSAHAETATRIWLRISREKGRVAVLVEDDGVGLSSGILQGIFSGSLRRLSRSRPDDRRSMGIGLSVCHSIIRAHGGGMDAGGGAHGGAAFRFWLPLD